MTNKHFLSFRTYTYICKVQVWCLEKKAGYAHIALIFLTLDRSCDYFAFCSIALEFYYEIKCRRSFIGKYYEAISGKLLEWCLGLKQILLINCRRKLHSSEFLTNHIFAAGSRGAGPCAWSQSSRGDPWTPIAVSIYRRDFIWNPANLLPCTIGPDPRYHHRHEFPRIPDWKGYNGIFKTDSFFSLSLGPLPYPYHRWTTFVNCLPSCQHFNGLVQERRNSSASAMELHLSCTNPSSRFNPCVPILLLFVLLLIVMLEAHYHIHQHQYLYNWVMTDIISVSLYICLVKKQGKRTQRLTIRSPAFGPHPLKGNIIKTFQINNSISLRLLC